MFLDLSMQFCEDYGAEFSFFLSCVGQGGVLVHSSYRRGQSVSRLEKSRGLIGVI